MLDVAMKFLRDFLNQEITSPANPVVLGNITKDTDIEKDKIHLSLLNIEEEKILKEVNHNRRINPGDDFYSTVNPEIRLNLYVLVTYQYDGKNYEEALKQLANVVTVLQGKYVFTKPDFMKPAYEPLQQLVVDLYSQTIEQNSNMWQALGEKLSPCLLYKIRVIAIQANRVLDTSGEVRAVGIDVIQKKFEN
ncbi:DUF4255 domain-containing protein [Mucilaginibacter sp.]|jgi:hypothetical protein|uniref:DUF4255 domain-containing protein n=1 Tax=Mucilaginibacter sp. TaxID=1882438 RepID=UPI002BD59C37|nr:DUF4255 domain-containing protein [Mucilaginibacter sp.]HTI61067.1 DUF4255 domain-containing protein [Mucilaginibacter sp.]